MRLLGELEGDLGEQACARLCVGRLDAFRFVVADAILARDEDHPGWADVVQVARVMSGRRRLLQVRKAEPFGNVADAHARLRRELHWRVREELGDADLAASARLLADIRDQNC